MEKQEYNSTLFIWVKLKENLLLHQLTVKL